MSYADPTAIKTAITGGATWSGGQIMVSGTPKKCLLAGGVWDLDVGNGDTMSRAVFNLIKNGSVNPNYTVQTSAGVFQLVSDGGVATLIDP